MSKIGRLTVLLFVWLAGLAMNGILANSDRFGGSAGRDAKEAYEFADAMLKERENGQ